jgi:hypothetical protein
MTLLSSLSTKMCNEGRTVLVPSPPFALKAEERWRHERGACLQRRPGVLQGAQRYPRCGAYHLGPGRTNAAALPGVDAPRQWTTLVSASSSDSLGRVFALSNGWRLELHLQRIRLAYRPGFSILGLSYTNSRPPWPASVTLCAYPSK